VKVKVFLQSPWNKNILSRQQFHTEEAGNDHFLSSENCRHFSHSEDIKENGYHSP
jgi:hypothetical protein